MLRNEAEIAAEGDDDYADEFDPEEGGDGDE